MSLPVPLSVRIGDKHVTKQVQSLSFRREAIGGVRSISFNLARSLLDLDGVDPLAKVYVYDARTAATVAEGRLADTGRGASVDGQKWECVAFGPAQHASDITGPKIYIDRSVSSGWRQAYVTIPEATIGSSSKPDAGATLTQGILGNFPTDVTVASPSGVLLRYEPLWATGGRLAYFAAAWDAGTNNTIWNVNMWTGANGAATNLAAASGASTSGGFHQVGAPSIPAGHNTPALQLQWAGTSTVTSGDDNWCWWEQVVVEAVRKNKSGADITSGYTGSTVASSIVEDLLGSGYLPEFDGPNATVAITSATFSQMAYMDGVTAAQILDDLMAIEPGYRWTTGPDLTGNGYEFRWEPWPTTVRYEATLDDGGSFPLSTQSLYNLVAVTYVDAGGSQALVLRSLACPILDGAGITRQAHIDLGSEVGSLAQAQAAGDAFLIDHNAPKNSGTLTVARPIRDVITGAMVQPWEIEAGELVRIRGVEAYPDAFNADSNDGQGVFRIFAVDYTTEGNTSTLSLDSDPRKTEDALVKLLNQRSRR